MASASPVLFSSPAGHDTAPAIIPTIAPISDWIEVIERPVRTEHDHVLLWGQTHNTQTLEVLQKRLQLDRATVEAYDKTIIPLREFLASLQDTVSLLEIKRNQNKREQIATEEYISKVQQASLKRPQEESEPNNGEAEVDVENSNKRQKHEEPNVA